MNRTARLTTGIGLSFALAAFLLLLQAAPAAAHAPEAGPVAAIAAPTAPAPCNLDLAGLEKGGACSAPALDETKPEAWVETASKRLGYCHCGCSSVRTCRTSADCGGASCDHFISCC